MTDPLLTRLVVPERLALIRRGTETVAYNPALNVWHRVDSETAECLRWLRAGRPASSLEEHFARRFVCTLAAARRRLADIARWALLRRLLYLDSQPDIPDISSPVAPLATIYWITTQKCNLRCTYCYQEATVARPAELSTSEALDLVDQARESGADTFVFTGGEPFARRDLLEVAAHAKAVGLRTTVITNGSYIRTNTIADVAAVFDLVTVSLDHMKPEHHDRFRGPGSWRRASQAIDLLVDAGVPVDVNSTLTRPGLPDLQALLRLSIERRIGQHKIVPQFPMGRAGSHREDELTPDELLGLHDAMVDAREADRGTNDRIRPEGGSARKGLRRAHCGAGLSEVSVDPEGWVYPCKLLQYPQLRSANVRDTRLTDIYRSHPVLQEARDMTVEHLAPCSTCIIKNDCGGGCRGIQVSLTHSYRESAPLFCAFLRRGFETRAWMTTGSVPRPRRVSFASTASSSPEDDSGE